MPMTQLDISETGVSDLTPLKGMPLTQLDIYATGVSDLTPLKGMRMTQLNIYETGVSDLTPLKGMPLQSLKLRYGRVRHLTPLKNMETLRSVSGMDLFTVMAGMSDAVVKEDWATTEQAARNVLDGYKAVPAFSRVMACADQVLQETLPEMRALAANPDTIPSQAKTFGGHHYLLGPPLKWGDAKAFCEKYGAHLATVTSQDEHDWIMDNMAPTTFRVWIGATSKKKTGSRQWVTSEKWQYEIWGPHQPNGYEGREPVALWPEHRAWDDISSDSLRPFLIEWDK